MQYETEAMIRTRAIDALKDKRRNAEGEVDFTRVQTELSDPRYTSWLASLIESAKKSRRLVTEQQLRDIRARREFQEGDRARYIGPTEMRTSQATGKGVLWKTGMTGLITRTQRGNGGQLLFTFLPDIDMKTRAAAEDGLDVEVLEVTTNDWISYERIP